MKMEVLAVQNQFQGQFGVIGSSKVKDWTTPLTPPPQPTSHSNLSSSSDIIDGISPSEDTLLSSAIINQDNAAVNALSLRLQNELRAAKSRHLSCTEVLLPSDLLHRVAAEIVKVSEKEPCGLRGSSIFIEFEEEPSNTRRIASLKVDPNTVSTFEIYLTLKHDKSGWTSMLPQFLKNLARSSTVMISPDFTLTKNKLYHNNFE